MHRCAPPPAHARTPTGAQPTLTNPILTPTRRPTTTRWRPQLHIWQDPAALRVATALQPLIAFELARRGSGAAPLEARRADQRRANPLQWAVGATHGCRDRRGDATGTPAAARRPRRILQGPASLPWHLSPPHASPDTGRRLPTPGPWHWERGARSVQPPWLPLPLRCHPRAAGLARRYWRLRVRSRAPGSSLPGLSPPSCQTPHRYLPRSTPRPAHSVGSANARRAAGQNKLARVTREARCAGAEQRCSQLCSGGGRHARRPWPAPANSTDAAAALRGRASTCCTPHSPAR